MDALRFACVVRERAAGAGIDARFIAATLLQESAFDSNAISLAGAYGIAQFTPATARAGGFDPFDPDAAIAGATSLLARYVAYYSREPHAGGDPYALALAAYNAGPGTVSYYGGVPPYPETREYISDIHERLARLIAEQ